MIRLLADENLNYDIVRGVVRRRPTLDVVRVQAVGLSEAGDPEVLAWAAKEQRVVLTHDVNTMTRVGIERITLGEHMAGLFIVHQQSMTLSVIIDDLILLDECSDTSEWFGRNLYLPLR
jgi:predicted nuclease of predicted toxin-antitoxin system